MKKIMSGIISILFVGLIIYVFGVIVGVAAMLIGSDAILTWNDVFIEPLVLIKTISIVLTAIVLCVGIIVAIIFIGADIEKRQRLTNIHKK